MGYYPDNTKLNKLPTRLNNKTTHNMWCVAPYLASIVTASHPGRVQMQASGRERLRKAMKYACAVLGLRGLPWRLKRSPRARHSKKFH